MIKSNIIQIGEFRNKQNHVRINDVDYIFHGADNYLVIAKCMDDMRNGIVNKVVSKQERLRLVGELHNLLLHCMVDDNLKGLTVVFSDKRVNDKLGFDARYVSDFINAMKHAYKLNYEKELMEKIGKVLKIKSEERYGWSKI